MTTQSENLYQDQRGKLFFPVKSNNFSVKETMVSINNLHVFRGVHIEQYSKLVTCIQGKILDIIINFNKNEEDYLIPKYYILDANTNQLLVKPNYGHAFLSLEDNSIVLYHYDGIYDPSTSQTINWKCKLLNIKLPIEDPPIISPKDENAPHILPDEQQNENALDYYVFGGNGFIGSVIMETLYSKNKTVFKTNLRLENVSEIEKELAYYKPKYVICSAGLTGVPNIEWCETNKTETIETNITYQMTLAQICRKLNIHLTIIGSGVIFKNDRFYTEEEEGNYNGNFYGKCRIILENMVKQYNNALYVRINYPISSKESTKNLITKLLSYKSIHQNKITLTYIDELIPYLIDMIEEGETGICNLINDGAINIANIMQIYSQKTKHSYETMEASYDEKKSCSLLSIGKLKKYNVKNVSDAVDECITKYIAKNYKL